MQMSVIFKSDAIEFRLTFCGYASRSAQRPSPAAAAPIPRNLRRPITCFFVDMTLPFRPQDQLASGTGSFYLNYVQENKFQYGCSPPLRSIHPDFGGSPCFSRGS